MSQVLISISVWLHTLATVIFIGQYLLLALIYFPALTKKELLASSSMLLSEVSKRSRPWMYISLLTFIITGVYLMLVDPSYQGVGNFSNPWSILMLVKHLVILVMVALGFWFNAILRVGPQMSTNSGAVQARKSFHLYANAMAACGVLVLLLTAFAQAK